MKTLTKLRSSAPILIGTVLVITGIAISAIAHPHNERQSRKKRSSWNQPNPRPQFEPPRGHYPRRLEQTDPRVRQFLFAPQPFHRPTRRRPAVDRPMPRVVVKRPMLPQVPMNSPFMWALDADEDGFIDAKEMAQAAEALRAMDLNDDGQIGPAEWRARPGRLPVEMNSWPEGRIQGNNAGRSSVGGERSARPDSKNRKSEKERVNLGKRSDWRNHARR